MTTRLQQCRQWLATQAKWGETLIATAITPPSKAENKSVAKWQKIGLSNNFLVARVGALIASVAPMYVSTAKTLTHGFGTLDKPIRSILHLEFSKIYPKFALGAAKTARSMFQVVWIPSIAIIGVFLPRKAYSSLLLEGSVSDVPEQDQAPEEMTLTSLTTEIQELKQRVDALEDSRQRIPTSFPSAPFSSPIASNLGSGF